MEWNKLKEGLAFHGIDCPIPYDKFDQYIDLVLEWNEKINLTRITEAEEVQIKHFLDSLTPLLLPYFTPGARVIDLGTGAGFPGLPLALTKAQIHMTLMDSLNKRVKFLDLVIKDLAMDNALAIHGRAEEMARTPDHREAYDICISRAVARLNVLVEYCLPFVKVGGHFISMKAEDGEEEIKEAQKAIKTLGGKIVSKEKFELFGSDTRQLIVIEKIEKTKGTYPRGGGKPRKNPL